MDRPGIRHAKIVVVGAPSSGKTAIIYRYIHDDFLVSHPQTAQPGFFSKMLTIKNQELKLEIWDTAGQEKFRALTPLFYRGSQGGLVVFDICCKKSFEGASTWINELRNERGYRMLIILVGNKIDLEAERAVTRQEAENVASGLEISYFETSAKNNLGITEMFDAVAESLVDILVALPIEHNLYPQRRLSTTVTVTAEDKNKSTCC